MGNEQVSLTNRVLVVDDEELNLDILEEYLEEEGYEVITSENGKEALDILENDKNFSAIILDRMMPVMDGMEFLKQAKEHNLAEDIPIIMQTAASTPEQIQQGIEAGVFYYLTKPYNKGTLIAVLNSALIHSEKRLKVFDEFGAQKRALGLLKDSVFKFQNLDEAKNLSLLIANFCPNVDKAIFGLHELTVNAIEHGNLGISYDEKKVLLEKNTWKQEIAKRLELDENKDKFATLSFKDLGGKLEITISDAGDGFNYEKYFDINSARMTDPNGRGIAMTKMYSFEEMEYLGSGNQVRCVIPMV